MKAGFQRHDERTARTMARVEVINSVFNRTRVLALLLFQETLSEAILSESLKGCGDKIPTRVINNDACEQEETDDAERDPRHHLQPVCQRKAQQQDDDARQDKEYDRQTVEE